MVPKQPISVIPSSLGFHCSWCCTFTKGLSQCPSQLLSMTPLYPAAFMQSKPVPPRRLSGSAANMTRSLDPLWTAAYMYWPWENIPRRFCLSDSGLLITMSLQSEGFIFVILSLVNHISSSAPADINQILKVSSDPDRVVKGLPKLSSETS